MIRQFHKHELDVSPSLDNGRSRRSEECKKQRAKDLAWFDVSTILNFNFVDSAKFHYAICLRHTGFVLIRKQSAFGQDCVGEIWKDVAALGCEIMPTGCKLLVLIVALQQFVLSSYLFHTGYPLHRRPHWYTALGSFTFPALSLTFRRFWRKKY